MVAYSVTIISVFKSRPKFFSPGTKHISLIVINGYPQSHFSSYAKANVPTKLCHFSLSSPRWSHCTLRAALSAGSNDRPAARLLPHRPDYRPAPQVIQADVIFIAWAGPAGHKHRSTPTWNAANGITEQKSWHCPDEWHSVVRLAIK